MQQRRPSHVIDTLTAEKALARLKTTPAADVEVNLLAAAIERYGVQLVEHLGVDAILDFLQLEAD
jgi:hypothetical protein